MGKMCRAAVLALTVMPLARGDYSYSYDAPTMAPTTSTMSPTVTVALNDDIGAWDTSGVTTMLRMFHTASSFNQDLGWCISASVDVQQMFWGAGCASTSCDVTFDCPGPP